LFSHEVLYACVASTQPARDTSKNLTVQRAMSSRHLPGVRLS